MEALQYMPMDRKDAEKVAESFLRASTLCDESLKVVKANDGLGQVKVFGRLAGAFLGHTYTNVLAPLWKSFPDLQPAAIKEPWTEPEPVLSPASQQALRTFLDQAYAALRLVENVVPQDERNTMFAFGGLPEVNSAVAEIGRFLASPRHREEEGHL
jgi:hypothetical protein